MMKNYYLSLATLVMLMFLTSVAAGQNTALAETTGTKDGAQTPAAANGSPFQERATRYRLRKGDTSDVDFAFSPEFNQVIAVQPDGYITLWSVGAMHVEGQTISELRGSSGTIQNP
jgi:protein involved in polysaccharide export with SLBB domain